MGQGEKRDRWDTKRNERQMGIRRKERTTDVEGLKRVK